jgi:4-amino-4-deoxy-L-arabinose transferase-like glycosyltransferase
MFSPRYSLAWLVAGLCAAVLLPTLFMRGMFFDGVFYANISMNFAAGESTFWEPKCSNTFYAVCHEQPPLFFLLQGAFFYVLGNSFLTERIYDLAAALLSVWLLLRVLKATGHGQSGWMAVLCWMMMPVTFWAFNNNVIEGTLGVFTLAAMLHVLRALHEGKAEMLHLLLAGVWIAAAGLTKGAQGMFLLAAPGLWWLVMRSNSFVAMLRQTALVLAVPLAVVAFCWFNDAAHRSFASYFESRLMSTFAGLNSTDRGRFHQLYELLLNVLPVMGIAALLFMLMRKKAQKHAAGTLRLAAFMLAAGLSGILPLMVTLEQRGFYLVTALPLVAIAFALVLHPYTTALQQQFSQRVGLSRIVSVAGITIFAGAVIASIVLCGSYKRDEQKLRDLEAAAEIIPHGSIIGNSANPFDWTLVQNAWRFYHISVAFPETPAPKWLLLPRGEQAPEGFVVVPCGLRELELWRQR